MIPKKLQPLLQLIALVLIVYGIHKWVFYQLAIPTLAFYYSIEMLYIIFFLFSFVLFIVITIIRKRYFDQIGMVFMGLSSLKMMLAYLLLRPILNATSKVNPIEKNNYFVIFVVFLIIETVLTVRILNEKGQNDK